MSEQPKFSQAPRYDPMRLSSMSQVCPEPTQKPDPVETQYPNSRMFANLEESEDKALLNKEAMLALSEVLKPVHEAMMAVAQAMQDVAKAQREQIELTYALLAEVAGEGEQNDDDLPQPMNSPR